MNNDDKLLQHLRAMKYSPHLDSDLWPRFAERLAQRPPRFTPWDWAIAAGIAAAMLLYPELAGALLYHF